MHDARHGLPVFLLDGDHIAPLAHGDDGVLQILLLRRRMNHRRKRVLDFLLRGADAPTELRQRHARVIAKRAVLVDGVVEAVFELPQDFKPSRPLLQRRRQLRRKLLEEALGLPRRVEHADHVGHLLDFQHGVHRRLFQRGANIADRAEGRR